MAKLPSSEDSDKVSALGWVYEAMKMDAKQRGNTILISAVLVFALTVAALTVSRLLTNYGQEQGPAREFLGEQARALCLSGLAAFGDSPGSTKQFSFLTPEASDTFGAMNPTPVVVDISAPTFALSSSFQAIATALLAGVFTKSTASGQVTALVTCGAAAPCSYVIVNQ